MKKYLFIGETAANTGPSNVNKGIISNLSEAFLAVTCENKVKKYLSVLRNIVGCKVVVVSGMSKVGTLAIVLAKLLQKKSIYIMHGCYEIEAAFFTGTSPDEESLKREQCVLKKVDRILAVSKSYAGMIQKRYAVCRRKTGYLHNGVDRLTLPQKEICREGGRVIAVGGDRKIKNNLVVARAMAKLNPRNLLTVYGYLYHPDALPRGENIAFKGLVPQAQLYQEMMRSELFVLNSVDESFGLSVFDALQCGCSVLVSRSAGVLELLDVTEHDVIENPMDEKEIAEKIRYLLAHPNHDRLMQKVDFEKISYKAEAKKLETFCEKLCSEGRTCCA